jgi:hypothetical protein
MSVYHVEYDGYYAMSWHDREENALKRWFENYKVGRYESFACETEWLVVKEVESSTRRKKRLVCEIGDDGRGTKREVIMDHTAPAAPILTFAAKRRYVPPPPKTAEEMRREAEWERMLSMGYEPIRRPRYRPVLMGIDWASGPSVSATIEMEYDVEWVPRRRSYYNPPPISCPPPDPPKHRRNV